MERIFTYHVLNLMPCKSCRVHYRQYIKEHPIRLDSAETLGRWLVRIHNRTNAQIGKKRFEYSKYLARYSSYNSKYRVRRSFLKWTSSLIQENGAELRRPRSLCEKAMIVPSELAVAFVAQHGLDGCVPFARSRA